jgi:hypothetical protein
MRQKQQDELRRAMPGRMQQEVPPIPVKAIGPLKIWSPTRIVEFHPQADLTLHELALLLQLCAWLARPGHWDWPGYLKEHGLERHFRDIEPQT